VIFRELGHLVKIPDLAATGGLTEKDEGLPLAVNFIVDLTVLTRIVGI